MGGEVFMIKVKQFKTWLDTTNYSAKTKEAYLGAINHYSKYFKDTEMVSVLAYKAMLCERNAPQTVNLRLRAINCYNEWMGYKDRHVAFVKIQRRTFLDNVISEADFTHLCRRLKQDGYIDWYFLVRFLGCTGARISEVLKFKTTSVPLGYLDIYGKGGKLRRIYIPKHLKEEAEDWISRNPEHFTDGLLFKWKPATIGSRLRDFAVKYKIDPKQCHPHAFRHRFAKSFIERNKDIALLADLLGHDSIETTRIYLTRTSAEQAKIVDDVVTW